MLSDTLIVTRNNHLCVGVKVEFKNVFKGIIMDYSQSGQTVYMEPMACAEIQARLNNLKFEENQEEIKILQKLTGQIGMFDNELNESLNNITYLDLISAKALFAVKYNCFKPNINENQNVKLINARHPLIDQSKVVPISIELGSNYKGIIITGPNTGGKTVALKTVGLLTLMTQSGLLIPADPESDINIFDKVFADIGDEQSIEQSLSTFSSHMTRIINIIDNVSLNSLVLFDELGSGTDPKEGSSLAIAIIKFLLERNSRIIITSHYLELKEFAYNNGDLLNASVEFDIKTLKPTYRLLLGTPGKSNALEIAKRLGLDKRVINYALEEIRSSDNNVNILIDKLETQGYELNEKIKYYNNLINEQKNIVNEYQNKMNIISKKEEEILNLAKKKGEEYLLEVQVKADDLIKQIENAKSNITTPELADIKHQVNTLTKGNLNSELEEHDINVDDIVLIKAYNQEGLVLSINKNKYKVQMNNLTLDFKKEELKYVRKNEKKKEDKKKKYNVSITSNVKKEGKMQLDLRGVRYEDVYDMIDKFIDNAILSNISQVSIVHGYGTGAVRKAVQEYIRKSSVIKSSRYGKEGEGLMGVTVCTLK
jgi:DNA mismatch repair protein MutS2